MTRKRSKYDSDQQIVSTDTASTTMPIIWHNRPGTTISSLYPELLAIIFSYLNVRDKGRVSQVSTTWRDAAYNKSVWKDVEAKLNLRPSNTTLFASLVRRGIKRIQILSLQRSLKEVIQGIPNLERLSLIGCYNLTNEKLISAFNQPHLTLTHLNLSMCKQITDRSLQKILPLLKVLKVLDLAGCGNITNSLLISINDLKNLKYLNLRSCRNISDTGISFLAGIRNGIKSSLSSSSSLSASLSSTSSSSSSGLSLDLNENCDTKTIEELSLECLVLQDCQKISDESLKYISLGLTKLKQLNLSFCAGITEFGLKYLSNLNNLTELNLRSCVNINDRSLQYLSEINHSYHNNSNNHQQSNNYYNGYVYQYQNNNNNSHQQQTQPQLQSLDISFCDKVTDSGLIFISNTFRLLNSLSLNSIPITDEGLIKVSQSLINLQTLNIGQCSKITDKSLIAISENCLQLKTVDLYGCINVTTIGIEKIMDLPNLKGLNLGLWEKSNDEEMIVDNTIEQQNLNQDNQEINQLNYNYFPHFHHQQSNQTNQNEYLHLDFYGNMNRREPFYFGNQIIYRDDCIHTKLCDSCQNVKLLFNSQVSKNSFYPLFRICDT